MRVLSKALVSMLSFAAFSSLAPAQALNNDLSLDAILDLKVETATKTAQKITEAPAIISVITAEDIAFWGYVSVGEALETVPGLYNVYDGLAPNYGVRGINGGLRASSRILKVMIDSQPVSFRSDTTALLGPELIPIHMVDHIEVVRGPASALYGANAFLGVVNVITKKGKNRNKTFEGHANAGFSKGRKGQGVELIGSAGRESWESSVGVSLQNYDRSGLKVPESSPAKARLTEQESENDRSKPGSLLARYQSRLNDNLKLELLANYNKLDAYAEFLDFGTLSHENHVVIENQFVLMNLGYDVSDHFSMNLSLAASQGQPSADEKLSSGSLDSYPRRDIGYQGRDLTFEMRYTLSEKNSIVAGLDIIQDEHQLPTIYTVSTASSEETASSGVQGKKKFINKGYYLQYTGYPLEGQVDGLGVTLNIRTDHHSVYEDKLAWRLGLVKNLFSSSHLKLLLGTSYKAPAAGQLYAQPLYSGEIIGNDELKPESASTIEAEFGHPLFSNVMATASIFRTEVKDKVELIPRGTNQRPENVGKQIATGAELEIKALLEHQQITGNLSYQNSIDRSEEPFLGAVEAPTTMYPAIVTNVAWMLRIPGSIQPGLKLKHVTERRASKSNILENKLRPYSLEPYTLAGAVIHMPLKVGGFDQSFNLRIDNLLNQQYSEPGFSGIDIPGRSREIILNYSASL